MKENKFGCGKSLLVRSHLKPVFRKKFIKESIPVQSVAQIVEDYLIPHHKWFDFHSGLLSKCFDRVDPNSTTLDVNNEGDILSSYVFHYISEHEHGRIEPNPIFFQYGTIRDFHVVRVLYLHCLKRSRAEGHEVMLPYGPFLVAKSVQTVLEAVKVLNQIYLDRFYN